MPSVQYSLKYATLLLVAFSLALASSSWFPPLGSGFALILLIVAVRLIFNPAWLRTTVRGAVLGAVAFGSVCMLIAGMRGEPPQFSPAYHVAVRYAIPLGGTVGGVLGHAMHVRSERSKREQENASGRSSDDSHAA